MTAHPWHMNGWEAFGVTGTEPTVRRLGTGHGTKLVQYGTEPWHPSDVHDGVATIEVSSHADAPAGYLYVCGTSEKAVDRAWRQASAAFSAFRDACWARVLPKATP